MMNKTSKRVLADITPDVARDYLSRNERNRPIRGHWVHELALRMKEGSFETRHDGLLVDGAGNLINGQHRLSAIVESGCTVKMWITTKKGDKK